MQELEKQARVEVLQKSSNMPRVVWTEESKNGLRFEIGPSYDDVQIRSQLVTDGQFSCSTNRFIFFLLGGQKLGHKKRGFRPNTDF